MGNEAKRRIPAYEGLDPRSILEIKRERLEKAIEAVPSDQWPIPVNQVSRTFVDQEGFFPGIQRSNTLDALIKRVGLLTPHKVEKFSRSGSTYVLPCYDQAQIKLLGILLELIETNNELSFKDLADKARSMARDWGISLAIHDPKYPNFTIKQALDGALRENTGVKVGRPSNKKPFVSPQELSGKTSLREYIEYKTIKVMLPKLTEEDRNYLSDCTPDKLREVQSDFPKDLFQGTGGRIHLALAQALLLIDSYCCQEEKRLKRLAGYNPEEDAMGERSYLTFNKSIETCLEIMEEKIDKFPNLLILYNRVVALIEKG